VLVHVPTTDALLRRLAPALVRPLAFEPAFILFFVFLVDFVAIASVDPEMIIKKNGQLF
jgi:hypothetical protein